MELLAVKAPIVSRSRNLHVVTPYQPFMSSKGFCYRPIEHAQGTIKLEY